MRVLLIFDVLVQNISK